MSTTATADERAEMDREHDAYIDTLRGRLADQLTEAERDVLGALGTLTELCSDSVFDIEFVEGSPGTDIRKHLDAAALALRAAQALHYRATRQ